MVKALIADCTYMHRLVAIVVTFTDHSETEITKLDKQQVPMNCLKGGKGASKFTYGTCVINYAQAICAWMTIKFNDNG